MDDREKILEEYLHSYDFMRIGQAISHGQWQTAAMIQKRLELKARELELDAMVRGLGMLRQAILHRKKEEGKQALAGVVARRVQMLNNK